MLSCAVLYDTLYILVLEAEGGGKGATDASAGKENHAVELSCWFVIEMRERESS